jgi:uncharacterized protein YxeA
MNILDEIDKYIGESKSKSSHAGQFEYKIQAQQDAKRLTQQTGVKHRVVKTKAYRENGLKEIEVWTVVADKNKKKYIW